MDKATLIDILTNKQNNGAIPSFPQIDIAYAAKYADCGVGEAFLNPNLHAKALQNALQAHTNAVGVYINLCLTGNALHGSQETLCITDSAGITWKVPRNDIGSPMSRYIKEINDIRLKTQDSLSAGIIETYRKISDETKKKHLIVPGITGPYSQVVFMLGLEETLVAMLDEPEKLHEVIKCRQIFSINWAQQLKNEGAECVWIGEGSASSSLISPEAYQEFVMPYARELVGAIHKMGMKCIMHVCGNINPSFEYVAMTGADAIDIDHMVDLSKLKQKLGRKICLKGNINPINLQTQTPQQVRAGSLEIANLADDNICLIISTGCLVPRDAKKECVEAMLNFTS